MKKKEQKSSSELNCNVMSSKKKQQSSKRASRDEYRGKYRDTEYESQGLQKSNRARTRQSQRQTRLPQHLKEYTVPKQSGYDRSVNQPLDVNNLSILDQISQSSSQGCTPDRGKAISGSWSPEQPVFNENREWVTSPQESNFNPDLIIEDISLSAPIILPEPVHEPRVCNELHQNYDNSNCAVCGDESEDDEESPPPLGIDERESEESEDEDDEDWVDGNVTDEEETGDHEDLINLDESVYDPPFGTSSNVDGDMASSTPSNTAEIGHPRVDASLPPCVENKKSSEAKWGKWKGTELEEKVGKIYMETTRWRRNIFWLPSGRSGEAFIEELVSLLSHFNTGSALQPVALTMLCIIFHLVLQKPSLNSTTKDHVRHLGRRMEMWRDGKLDELLEEGRAIQKRFSRKKKVSSGRNKVKSFTLHMESGRISAALRYLGNKATSLLKATPGVLKSLREKHPKAQKATAQSLIPGEFPPKPPDVIFDDIDASAIFKAAKNTHGAAGPSGGDADLWKRLLCSKQFKRKPTELCVAVAELARKINTVEIDPQYLRAFVASRLLPLDKKPGVRPIGIGEVLRRIVGKATTTVLKPELVNATAPLQTCAGLPGGIEASIHAVRKIYEDPSTEGLLLVDATNAFNSLNREAALHNIRHTCPEFATYVRNIYRCKAELFLPDSKEVIYSEEGTTQGGPESMGFYAATTISLTKRKKQEKNVLYADDALIGGVLTDIRDVWLDVQKDGPGIGYYPNPEKTILITKPEHYTRALQLFPYITVTIDGQKYLDKDQNSKIPGYLGSFIGEQQTLKEFVDKQVEDWCNDIDDLSSIAKTDPQLAYSAYIYGTSKRWQFLCRTTPGISGFLHKLEEKIRSSLIPAITGRDHITDDMRLLYSLPARLGGLGFLIPTEEADLEFSYSQIATKQLTEAIFNQERKLRINEEERENAIDEIQKMKNQRYKDLTERLSMLLPEKLWKLVQFASEKGASSWLTSLPLAEYGFRLNKEEFVDAICLRYDLKMEDVPRLCVCGDAYSINHCLTCRRGGFVIWRHDTIRNTIFDLVKDVCKDTRKEPALLPVGGRQLPAGSNTSDGARSDVSALGFWRPLCRAFFDIKVFNPLALTNWTMEIPKLYTYHENLKKTGYNARILEIDQGTFTPLIMNCSGGVSPETEKFIKKLAEKVSI